MTTSFLSGGEEAARGWWHRLGFPPFNPDDPDNLDLYLLTAEISATLDHLGR